MKHPCLPPLAILLALLLLSLWNGQAVSDAVFPLRQELLLADAFAAQEDWPSAEASLQKSLRSWEASKPYLRIAAHHDPVEGADVLFRQAQLYAEEQSQAEFRAAVAALRTRLQQLAQAERCSIGNIL